MKNIVLGRTGIKLKALGFGGIPIQRVSSDEAIKVVKRCYELGVNYYDTARGYTVSEERIGKALEKVRDEVILATKSSRRAGAELFKELEISLKNLRTEYIDVYQLHNISSEEDWEKVRKPDGALEAMYRALDKGKIRHLGITSHNPTLLTEIVKENIFETIMIPYNYLTLEPEEELLPLCRKMNTGIIAMKPFGGGAFSNANTALKFLLGKENVDVVIPGMMTVEEVEENFNIASGDNHLTGEEINLIQKDKKELGNQFCRACNYCQPCPQEIPIRLLLRVDSVIKRMGWRPGTEERFSQAIEKASTCIECGRCEERCPYHLPIRELIPEKIEYVSDLLENRR